jgi:hypothetical protein
MHVKLQFREQLQVKIKEKASGFPHMIGMSFIGKCISKLISGIDAVSV